jgi:predicted patatin/cPLA2 family phospholipase
MVHEGDDNRNSERGIVLVIQGGAMRVAYALGVLGELQRADIRQRVKAIYCSSAGVVAALGFAGAELKVFSDSLFERLAGRRFINFHRILNIVDVPYLVDDVIESLVDLDSDSLFETTPIVVSVVDSANGMMRYEQLSTANCRRLTYATMAIPVLHGRTVEFEGRHYVDGGLGTSAPLAHALERHPNDVLGVVLTRTASDITDRVTNPIERTLVRLLPTISAPVRLMMLGKSLLDQQTEGWVRKGAVGCADIIHAAPDSSVARISRTSTDLDELHHLMDTGRADGAEFCANLRLSLK